MIAGFGQSVSTLIPSSWMVPTAGMIPARNKCFFSDGSANWLYSLFHTSECAGMPTSVSPNDPILGNIPDSALIAIPTSPAASIPPSTEADATATVNQQIANGILRQQASAQSYFDSLSVTFTNSDGSTTTIPWYMTLAIGFGLVGLLNMVRK